MAEPGSAASGTAASSVGRSAVNQLSASSAVAGPPITTPGWDGAGAATGAKYGSINVAAGVISFDDSIM